MKQPILKTTLNSKMCKEDEDYFDYLWENRGSPGISPTTSFSDDKYFQHHDERFNGPNITVEDNNE